MGHAGAVATYPLTSTESAPRKMQSSCPHLQGRGGGSAGRRKTITSEGKRCKLVKESWGQAVPGRPVWLEWHGEEQGMVNVNSSGGQKSVQGLKARLGYGGQRVRCKEERSNWPSESPGEASGPRGHIPGSSGAGFLEALRPRSQDRTHRWAGKKQWPTLAELCYTQGIDSFTPHTTPGGRNGMGHGDTERQLRLLAKISW